MKMELSIRERLTLMAIIPKQGNMATYRSIQSLRDQLGFNEQELIKWEPTICYDTQHPCPRCQGEEWKQILFAPILRCTGCDFQVGIGEPGAMVWRTLDAEGSPVSDLADVEFGEAGVGMIVDTLKLFEKNEEIDDDTAPLYEKFVEGPEQQEQPTGETAPESEPT